MKTDKVFPYVYCLSVAPLPPFDSLNFPQFNIFSLSSLLHTKVGSMGGGEAKPPISFLSKRERNTESFAKTISMLMHMHVDVAVGVVGELKAAQLIVNIF